MQTLLQRFKAWTQLQILGYLGNGAIWKDIAAFCAEKGVSLQSLQDRHHAFAAAFITSSFAFDVPQPLPPTVQVHAACALHASTLLHCVASSIHRMASGSSYILRAIICAC